MQWDVLFLLRGLPRQYHAHGKNFFIVIPDDAFVRSLEKCSQSLPQLKSILFGTAPGDIAIAGFRTDSETDTEAASEAYSALEAMLDGVSLLLEELQPQIGPCLLRKGDSFDLRICAYMPTGYFRWGKPDDSDAKVWAERNSLLANYILAFINCIAFTHAPDHSNLQRQLGYSLKMARQGITSRNPGIEYLCKFSALEGLVCGLRTKDKASILNSRLSDLFKTWPKDQLASDVKRLWRQRCQASHQACAFDPKLHSDVFLLDKLVLGVFVFALDHLHLAKTVDELWSQVEPYNLPSFVLAERPVGMVRSGAKDILIISGIVISNLGSTCDATFRQSEATLKKHFV